MSCRRVSIMTLDKAKRVRVIRLAVRPIRIEQLRLRSFNNELPLIC